MSKEPKYEEAYAELQSIVRRMENDELDIDQLTAQLKRAQQLIKLCKDKLTKTDEDIKKILEEQEQEPPSLEPAKSFRGLAQPLPS